MSSEFTSTSGRRSFAQTTIAAEMYCPACDRSFSELEQRCPHDDSPLVRLSGTIDSLEGRTLDERFTLLRRLGRGGMGAVYRARQLSIGRDVAVKVIKPEIGADLMAARRFLREARLASRLTSPHSVSVLEFGQSSDGLLFLVMELLQGRTLAKVMRDEGPMSAERVIGIGIQLCDALQAAHDSHIVHRDLKPSNIVMLDEPSDRDFVKVLDFGLAKSLTGDSTTTQSGQLMGTPTYIAPETILEGTVDPRSDLYALGVILYELLAGEPPFAGDNINALLLQHAYTPAPALGEHVPPALAAVVARLLEKDLNARYPSAAVTRAALEAVAENAEAPDASAPLRAPSQPVALPPTQRIEAPPPKRSRRRLVAAIAVAAVTTTAVVLALGLGPGDPEASAGAADAGAPLATKNVAAPSETADAGADALAEAPADPDAASAEQAVEAEGEPASKIELSLRSTPPARVLINGSRAGTTPLDLELDARDEAIQIEFRRRGRVPVTRRVRGDRSHSLDVVLPHAARRPAPARQSEPPASEDPPRLPF